MTLIEELASLDRLTSKELRGRSLELTGGPSPRVSPSLLRLALAWELQARAFGGHTREITHLLAQFESGAARRTSSLSTKRSAISWDGRYWNSLSEVVRAITGTRWSGAAFFGLKKTAA